MRWASSVLKLVPDNQPNITTISTSTTCHNRSHFYCYQQVMPRAKPRICKGPTPYDTSSFASRLGEFGGHGPAYTGCPVKATPPKTRAAQVVFFLAATAFKLTVRLALRSTLRFSKACLALPMLFLAIAA